jgi:hypothetical protein
VVTSVRAHDENNWHLHIFSDEENVESFSIFCTGTWLFPIIAVRIILKMKGRIRAGKCIISEMDSQSKSYCNTEQVSVEG